MSNEPTNNAQEPNNHNHSPSSERALTPPSRPPPPKPHHSESYSLNNEMQSLPAIVPAVASADIVLNSAAYTDKQCRVCNKKFGMRRMRRKHTCRRCGYKVCGNHSSKKRYDSATDQMVRVCDKCLSSEHCIVMTHRLRNLKLKHNKRNRGTYIVKVANTSKEYGEGLVNKCKIIEINDQNVESLNAQLIADKLNTIKIPFSVTLDYSEAEIKHDQLKKLNKNRKHSSPNKNNEKKESKSASKSDNKAIGTSQLMNVHQNPTSPYYYGPPQQLISPVIVTGPSNDMRNMYKLPQIQATYSDSYNEQYYDQREDGVSYDEPSKKRMTNGGPHDEDTEDEAQITSSDNEEEYEDNTENEGTDGEDRYDAEGTPELMQYEDSDHEDVDSDNKDEVEHEHAKSDDDKTVISALEIDTNKAQSRSKSVPATPTLIAMKLKCIAADIDGEDGEMNIPETPLLAMALPSDHVGDTTSYTPKGNKSTHSVLLKENGDISVTRPRSWSQDNLDPTSPPLIPQMHARIEEAHTDPKKKKKSGIFRRKQKHKKRKKKRKKDAKKDKFFRKKSRKKSMENYMNLHDNINEERMKPVINSSVREYTIQNLHPPHYQAMNGGHHIPSPTKHASAKHHHHHYRRANFSKYEQRPYKMMQNVQRQRMEMQQQHIAQSNHLLVNPYRQFCIAFDARPFNIKLQFRNGFTAFMNPSSTQIQQSHTLTRPEYVWGWYSVEKHGQIPIGSKLISINFEWIYGRNQEQIAELMYNSALPTSLIFEAPSYLNHVPPSVHMQLSDVVYDSDEDSDINVEDDELTLLNWKDVMRYIKSKKSIIFWWMEEGGFVALCLCLAGLIVLKASIITQLYYYLPICTAFVTIFVMNLPQKHKILDTISNILHQFIFGIQRRRRAAGLKLFGLKLVNGGKHAHKMVAVSYDDPHVSISSEQSLLNPVIATHGIKLLQSPQLHPMQSRKSSQLYHSHNVVMDEDSPHMKKVRSKARHRHLSVDRAQEALDSSADEDEDEKEDKEEEEENKIQLVDNEEEEEEDDDDIDPDWETNVCFPGGNTKTWGSFAPCTATTLKLRGGTYLDDKIKIFSKESLFSLANMDIFTVHHRIHHMAQHEVSWFHQNRTKLPRSLFFIIVHLRLDSMTASVVQYFYIDRNKFKHLLQSNEKIAAQAEEKGDGYFAIGGNQFDESGMFWNFINGTCKYRNDRLKLLARKEEGPWYMQIPSRPAIIGRQVPIEYYRGYNANHLNSTKTHSTKSDAYEPYEVKTLYHDANIAASNSEEVDRPCDCGKCLWINTNGEYPDYLEIDITPEVNAVAKRTVRIACPLAKSLQIEMQWTMEGQINNVELPERMLCSARLIHVDLTKLVELD